MTWSELLVRVSKWGREKERQRAECEGVTYSEYLGVAVKNTIHIVALDLGW